MAAHHYFNSGSTTTNMLPYMITGYLAFCHYFVIEHIEKGLRAIFLQVTTLSLSMFLMISSESCFFSRVYSL